MTQTIKTNKFSNLLWACNQLQSKYQILCPTVEDGVEHYRPLDSINDEQVQMVEGIAFRNKPPLGSIKSFLFPDSEIYIKFTRRGNKVEMEELEAMAPQIILGAKPCDIKSMELIDKVFLVDPVDTLYKERRDKTTIIATPCAEMGPSCNCEEFNICRATPRADLLMVKDDQNQEEIYLKSNSKRGEELLQQLLAMDNFAVSESFPGDEQQKIEKIIAPEKMQKQMDELFHSPIWDNLAMLCMGCGTCTYYCPTCHCYDIQDFNRKDQGVRYRTWDSCMFANFTNMAGNHNPRPTKADRIKNRFFHKLNYFVKKQGDLACVGCGRCAELCPVGISINTLLKKIGGELHET